MRRPLWILAVVALAAVLAVGLVQAGGQSKNEDGAGGSPRLADELKKLEGSPPALARLHDRAGELVPATVSSYGKELRGLRGYPVVVNAWASWCGPCKLEFPVFQSVSASMGRRVAFLGLNVADNRADAKAFLAKKPVPYPHLEDRDSRIVQRAGAAGGLPTTIFYDKSGKRTFIHQGGYTSAAALTRDIKRYAGA